MAIGAEDIGVRKQKEFEETISSGRMRALEDDIDRAITIFYEKKERWFSQKIKITANFSYSKKCDNGKTLKALILINAISSFLERYRRKGWTVKYRLAMDGRPWLSFLKIIEPQIQKDEPDAQSDINPKKTKLLQEKQKELKKLRAQTAEIEAEIQMLTESPNSRDAPLMLTQ